MKRDHALARQNHEHEWYPSVRLVHWPYLSHDVAQKICQTSRDGTCRWCIVVQRNVVARPRLAARYGGECALASGDGGRPRVLVQDEVPVRELVG